MSSNTPTAEAQAEGGAQYTVYFVNNSENYGSACLFQRDPGGGGPDVLPLAWFSQVSRPTTRISFRWSVDYCFVWAETGQLMPGVVFEASQMLPADLSRGNKVTFASQWGSYSFQNQTAGPQPGSLYIQQDATIPERQVAVGIGMSGSGTFAAQAQPNTILAFTPRPNYWIAFGRFIQGQVLDVEQLYNAAEIMFPPGVYSMMVTLNANNTLTIRPASVANAESPEAEA